MCPLSYNLLKGIHILLNVWSECDLSDEVTQQSHFRVVPRTRYKQTNPVLNMVRSVPKGSVQAYTYLHHGPGYKVAKVMKVGSVTLGLLYDPATLPKVLLPQHHEKHCSYSSILTMVLSIIDYSTAIFTSHKIMSRRKISLQKMQVTYCSLKTLVMLIARI